MTNSNLYFKREKLMCYELHYGHRFWYNYIGWVYVVSIINEQEG